MSIVGGAISFYIPNYAYSTATSVDSSGRTDGLSAATYTGITIIVVVYHGIVLIGSRHLSKWLIMMYIISFLLFFPITTFLNDTSVKSAIYLSTFKFVMRSATYWLSIVLASSTMLLVYYGVHVVWYQFLYP
jgi:hypothetical protein